MTERKLTPQYILDDDTPATFTETKYEPKEKVEVLVASVNGIRVLWNGPHQCTVERLDVDGEWRQMKGVQRVEVVFDVKEILPIIKIDEVALPKIHSQFGHTSLVTEL